MKTRKRKVLWRQPHNGRHARGTPVYTWWFGSAPRPAGAATAPKRRAGVTRRGLV